MSCWRIRPRPAPRAIRMASSWSRRTRRESERLATLAHAINRTNAEVASRTKSGFRDPFHAHAVAVVGRIILWKRRRQLQADAFRVAARLCFRNPLLEAAEDMTHQPRVAIDENALASAEWTG